MRGRRAFHAKTAAIIALGSGGLAYGRYHTASSWFTRGWQVALIVVAIAAGAIFAFGLYRHVSAWLSGREGIRLDGVSKRLQRVLRIGLLQKKVLRDPVAGPIHFALSAAFVVLLGWYTLQSLGLGAGHIPYLVVDLLYGILGLTALGAIYLRFVTRRARLRRTARDVAIVLLLLGIAASYFAGRGLGDLPDAHPSSESARFAHVLFVSTFLALIPYTKLFHLVTAPLSIFLAEHDGQAVPPAPFNLKEQTEKEVALQEGSFGLAHPMDLPLFRLISLDACTTCGRCQAVCPAFESEKPLSPMSLVLKLRDLARVDGAATLWDSVSSEEVLSCTTCGACVAECPVLVEHVGLVTDLRRDLVYEAKLQDGHQRTLQRLAETHNPWGQSSSTRAAWAQSEGLKEAQEGEEYDYLYWLGCAAAFDARVQSVARTVYDLLTKAELRVAIIASKERCTGDVARRIGEEGLFQKLALANIEAIEQVNAKAIVTHCPHCLQSIRNEYSLLGAKFGVFHHTEVLAQLVEKGAIRLTHEIGQSITYHDPCYLGRHNGVFDAPRALLDAVPSADVREMARSRDKSFCCGAGGGQMWLDTEWGKGINLIRTEEALQTGAQTIATACPFCTVMLEEGLQLTGADSVKVKDVSELVAEAADRS